MSYKQAMKWAKKHPKGIRNLYFGFDSHMPAKKPTEEEAREFYPKYVEYHQKIGTKDILTLEEYIKIRTS